MTAMKRHLRMNVIVDVRGMNVNMRVGDKSAEGLLYVLSAKGAQFNASLGQRPRNPEYPTDNQALKARLNLSVAFQSQTYRSSKSTPCLRSRLAVFLLKGVSAMVLCVALRHIRTTVSSLTRDSAENGAISPLPEKTAISERQAFVIHFEDAFLYLFDELSLG